MRVMQSVLPTMTVLKAVGVDDKLASTYELSGPAFADRAPAALLRRSCVRWLASIEWPARPSVGQGDSAQ